MKWSQGSIDAYPLPESSEVAERTRLGFFRLAELPAAPTREAGCRDIEYAFPTDIKGFYETLH
jgi:hypothetical protein